MMKKPRLLPLLCATTLSLSVSAAFASVEDAFLEKFTAPQEQEIGYGRTALWTLSLVATEYQPTRLTPAMQQALQAQSDGRFLEALILIEEACKKDSPNTEAGIEQHLMHASFLLQGRQSKGALEILDSLLAHVREPRYRTDAHALAAMAYLLDGKMQQALEEAKHAHNSVGGTLPHMALSYVLQGMGRLPEAREAIHEFNGRIPQAVTLAREAELALTLDQVTDARALLARAEGRDAAHPYVVAVGGLVHLVEGKPVEAKAAFEAALKRDPRDGKALMGLGLAEVRLGNFETGRKKLEAARDAEPGNALILTYLGRAQQQAGLTAEARTSWEYAQDADRRDPTPWLYQAQAELQANRLGDARESLRQAQARAANRSVYRGANLLREDEQLLASNLAAIQSQLGMETLAFHTLSDGVGEKTSTTLRNQADLLQGRRFAESARRSLLLQSLFDEHPGNLPSELDVYGDGGGQTGASSPQHGEVGGLNAQQASYNNYDELFSPHAALAADGILGGQHTEGGQVRAGIGSDTLGVSVARREYKTDGHGLFNSLDNRIEMGVVQWRPLPSTQAFVSHQTFDSRHGEIFYPADAPEFVGAFQPVILTDTSRLTRAGLRHSLNDHSELRALWSEQKSKQDSSYFDTSNSGFCNSDGYCWPGTPEVSGAHAMELQYRQSGAGHATQWGVQQNRAHVTYYMAPDDYTIFSEYTRTARHAYAGWQQALGPRWQLDAQLGWGTIEQTDHVGTGNTYLKRWLPKLGLVYTPDDATHLRAAVWRGMGFGDLGEASLAPASVAGVLLNRPGDTKANGMLTQAVALGADRQLNAEWLLEGQWQRRWTDLPGISGGQQVLYRSQIDESRLALHWQPGSQRWATTLAWDYESFQAPPSSQGAVIDSVQEQRLRALQLGLRWFASAQWTANLALSHNRVDGSWQTSIGVPPIVLVPFRESFDQADAAVDWKFDRNGALTMGVRNAGDASFRYTNIDPLTPRFSKGQLVYAKLKFAW